MNIAQPNITLTLDLAGVIQTAALSSRFDDQDVSGWVGSSWAATVADTADDPVQSMLQDAMLRGVSAYREVTQHFPSGLRLPMEYMVVRLGGAAGMIAVGRSLAAVQDQQARLIATQHSLEQDHWRSHGLHPRAAPAEPAPGDLELLIRAKTLRVLRASPAATLALDLVAGSALMPLVPGAARDSFLAALRHARQHGRAPGIVLHLGRYATPWVVRISLRSAAPDRVFRLELEPANPLPQAVPDAAALPFVSLLDELPDAFVVVDESGVIRHANAAFLDLAQAGAGVIGESLNRWLSQPGTDALNLLAQLRLQGRVRLFPSQLSGTLGRETPVEISAAASTSTTPPLIGILLRDIGGRATAAGLPGEWPYSVVAALGERIGSEPLPSLVRSTVALVESACIDSALKLAKGNRTLAADLLGVSRQALYTKLGRRRDDAEGLPSLNGADQAK